MFDAEEQSKYREFKEPEGVRRITCAWKASLVTTFKTITPAGPVQRESLSDECEILVVGRICQVATVVAQAAGLSMFVLRKSGDVRRTWYWNRYGIACDVESYSYFPLLEEMGYVPSMKLHRL